MKVQISYQGLSKPTNQAYDISVLELVSSESAYGEIFSKLIGSNFKPVANKHGSNKCRQVLEETRLLKVFTVYLSTVT